MDDEAKSVGISVDRVPTLACSQCGCEIDVSALEPFTTIECPECGHQDTVPAKLGQFLLLRLIGTGGMGGVYVAKDETLGRLVAIKVMLASLGENREFVETFKREAQAAAKLNHPNIAQIYSFGQEKGQPYIVMELVSGRRFDKMVAAEQPLDQALVMQIGMDIAEGLRVADEIGLVHGDIKPENILLDEKMNAKLVDFGIATFAHQAGDSGIWGTPYYISPEKVQRRKADARSDIYSLGATLYHALSGRPPFDGDTPVEVVKARLGEKPEPLKRIRKDIDANVDRIVGRMLEPEPANRYPTYASLVSDMTEALKALNVDSKHRAAGTKSKKVLIKKKRSVTLKKGGAGADDGGTAPPSGKVVLPGKSTGDAAEDSEAPADSASEQEEPETKKPAGSRTKVVVWIVGVLVVALAATGTLLYLRAKRNRTIAARREWFALIGARTEADQALSEIQVGVDGILRTASKSADYIPRARTAAGFILEEPLGDPPKPKPKPEPAPEPGASPEGESAEGAEADAGSPSADKPSSDGEAEKTHAPDAGGEDTAEQIAKDGEPAAKTSAEEEKAGNNDKAPPQDADEAGAQEKAQPEEAAPQDAEDATEPDTPEEGAPAETEAEPEAAEQGTEEPESQEIDLDKLVNVPEPRLLGWKVILQVRKIAAAEEKAKALAATAQTARDAAAKAARSQAARKEAERLGEIRKTVLDMAVNVRERLAEAHDALERLETIQKKVAREREAQRKAEEEAARLKAEQERQRREQERRQAKIDSEVELAQAARKDVQPLIKRQKYGDALRSLKSQAPKFETEEGKAALQVGIDRCERLQGLTAFLAEQLTAKPLKWGWIQERSTLDVEGADKFGVKLRGRRVPWTEVTPRQMLHFIKRYVSPRDRDVDLAVLAQQYLAAAIYCHVHGGNDLARAYAEKAVSLTPSLAREVDRLLSFD